MSSSSVFLCVCARAYVKRDIYLSKKTYIYVEPLRLVLAADGGLRYGVATISTLLKMIGLFCRISSVFQGSFAKETYNLNEPTNCSHPILWGLEVLLASCVKASDTA